MRGLLREEKLTALLNEIKHMETLLIELSQLDEDKIPETAHQIILKEAWKVWLHLNSVIDPNDKWRFDPETYSTISKVPHHIPLLIREMKTHNQGLH